MKIVILGAGTSAKSVACIIHENKEYSISGFICSESEKDLIGKNLIYDYKVIGTKNIIQDLRSQNINGFVVAIGDILLKEILFYECLNSNLIPINVISKNATVSNTAKLGLGNIIKSGAIIGHNVIIGDNNKIGTSAVIEINSILRNNIIIESGTIIAGEVVIEKNVMINSRVIINPYITIGKNQIIEQNQIISENLKTLNRE